MPVARCSSRPAGVCGIRVSPSSCSRPDGIGRQHAEHVPPAAACRRRRCAPDAARGSSPRRAGPARAAAAAPGRRTSRGAAGTPAPPAPRRGERARRSSSRRAPGPRCPATCRRASRPTDSSAGAGATATALSIARPPAKARGAWSVRADVAGQQLHLRAAERETAGILDRRQPRDRPAPRAAARQDERVRGPPLQSVELVGEAQRRQLARRLDRERHLRCQRDQRVGKGGRAGRRVHHAPVEPHRRPDPRRAACRERSARPSRAPTSIQSISCPTARRSAASGPVAAAALAPRICAPSSRATMVPGSTLRAPRSTGRVVTPRGTGTASVRRTRTRPS